VKPKDNVIASWESLQSFIIEMFCCVGVTRDDAETVAGALIWANLRGVDSHGVQLLPWYIEAIKIGHFNIKSDMRIEKESQASAIVEASLAMGAVVNAFGMKLAIEKAKNTGIGWVFIRNTNHQGALGHYSQMAAMNDMAGIAWVCSIANTVPYGARAPGIANNPISISVPRKSNHPLTLDMSTSVAAAQKIAVAKARGMPIPEGWALDREGNPTTDPEKAAVLLPVAGAKGSGLALMLECLSSVMVANPRLEPVLRGDIVPLWLGTMIGNPERIRRAIQNSVAVAIDIGAFTDVDSYKTHIENLIAGIKKLPRADGCDEILVPGEPEVRNYERRMKEGIPIPQRTALTLQNLAESLGVKVPW
jgi:LDH2 family malate/lactate/ureidoglycolate dehydrogenase